MGERTAEEWGRVAVALPGWRWLPGMLDTEGDRWGGVTLHDGAREVLRAVTAPKQYAYEWSGRAIDPDDPATAGTLLALLGPEAAHMTTAVFIRHNAVEIDLLVGPTVVHRSSGPHRNLGRTCIATAEAIGRWPGGAV